MFKRGLISAGLLLSSTTALAIPYGFSDARSVAMGNVSAATGGVTTAAFSNPAMLMVNESNDAFALHIGLGAVFIEDGDIVDDIDKFQVVAEQLDNIDTTNILNAPTILSLVNQEIQIINDLDGDSLVGRASPNVAIIYGGDSFSVAVTAEMNGVASGGILNINGLNQLELSQVLDEINNSGSFSLEPSADLTAIGVVTTELGVSIASDFKILGLDMSVGVKPKMVSAEGIFFNQTISTVDTADIIDDTVQDLGSFTTFDAGAVVNFSDSLRVGVVAKNLISESFTVIDPVTLNSHKFDLDTMLRVGAAYSGSFFTIAADMDLTESDPILLEDPSKMLALGVEFNVFDFVQLRGGYQTNIAGGASSDDLLSAGVGLWLGFNLDVAAVVSESSVGVFLQTGFRF